MSREELEALGWRFTVRVRKDGKVGVLAVATEPDGGETEIWRGYFGSEDAALAALLPDVTAMEGIRSKWDVAGMSYHVIALVDEWKLTWTAISLSTHETLADCMADYRRQQKLFRQGGFDADVKSISVSRLDDSGGAADTQTVATERTNERTKGR